MKSINLCLAIFFIGFFTSCEIDESIQNPQNDLLGRVDPESQIVLGEKRNNPFTIENVRLAMDQLESQYQKENRRTNCILTALQP